MARNILNRNNEFVGLDQKIWLALESGGYGSAASSGLPIATDGIEHTTAKIDFSIPRDDSEARSGRSKVLRLSGKKEVKWSFESYIVPADPSSGDPVLPDLHPMLLTAFGSVDQSDSSKKVYKLASNVTSSFRLLEEGTHFSRVAIGCVADSATFTLPGDGKAMFKAEGFGQDVYLAGQSAAALAGVATNDFQVASGHGYRFEVGSYVDIIDKDDGTTLKATARQVTAKTGDVLTLSGAVMTFDAADIIIGAVPAFTATTSANALLGLKGSFTTSLLGSVGCDLLSAEISIKNNYTPRNAYGKSAICGYVADKRREIGIKLDILLTQDNFEFYSKYKNFIADNLTIVLAPQDIPAPAFPDADGRSFTFRFPKVEFDVPALEQPSDGFIKLSLTGVALTDDINTLNNEMTLEIS